MSSFASSRLTPSCFFLFFFCHPPVIPSSLAYTDTSRVYTKNSIVSPNTPSSEGGPVVSYAITPALPAGLSLDTSTGTISGQPTVLSTTATTYTVTATNSGGEDTVDIVITVNDSA